METPAGAVDARKRLTRALGVLALAAALANCAPADSGAALAQNVALCENGTFPEQSIAACSAVVAETSAPAAQRAAALVMRGRLRADQGQHARAVADFGRALRLDPNNADALSERGAVHQDRGAFEIALRDYDAALAIDPRNSIAVYRRDQAVRGRVDAVREQLAQLTQLIAREPENAAALNDRCWLRAINDEDYSAALADCNEALRLQPNAPEILDSRGLVHLKRGEFDAALSDYEAALAAQPLRGHFLYGHGLALVRLGHAEAGQADLAAAEAAEPGVAVAYVGYGYLPAVAPVSGAEATHATSGNATP